jgi:hypothetical protein
MNELRLLLTFWLMNPGGFAFEKSRRLRAESMANRQFSPRANAACFTLPGCKRCVKRQQCWVCQWAFRLFFHRTVSRDEHVNSGFLLLQKFAPGRAAFYFALAGDGDAIACECTHWRPRQTTAKFSDGSRF